MADYSVELKRSAQKELGRLPGDVLTRMVAKLEKLALEPRLAGSKKLKGGEHEYRVRVGEYRAVYVVDDTHSTPECGVRITQYKEALRSSRSLR